MGLQGSACGEAGRCTWGEPISGVNDGNLPPKISGQMVCFFLGISNIKNSNCHGFTQSRIANSVLVDDARQAWYY